MAEGSKKETIYIEKDGLPHDGVSFDHATDAQLESYTRASEALHSFKAPWLYDSSNPNSYLWIGLMDGTDAKLLYVTSNT